MKKELLRKDGNLKRAVLYLIFKKIIKVIYGCTVILILIFHADHLPEFRSNHTCSGMFISPHPVPSSIPGLLFP